MLQWGPNQPILRFWIPIWVGVNSGVTMALPAGVGWLQLLEPGDHRKEVINTLTYKFLLQTAPYEWIHERVLPGESCRWGMVG